MAGQIERRTGPAAAGPLDRLVDDLAQLAHVVDRHDDLDVERLAHAGVDDRDRPAARPCRRGRLAVEAAEEAGDLLERALRGRQADALGRPLAAGLEPLEGQRQVGAPLGGGQGVDLVDDHRLDVDAASRGPPT